MVEIDRARALRRSVRRVLARAESQTTRGARRRDLPMISAHGHVSIIMVYCMCVINALVYMLLIEPYVRLNTRAEPLARGSSPRAETKRDSRQERYRYYYSIFNLE